METTIRPYDLNVTEADLSSAHQWWRSLSLNEMKAHRAKYFPNFDWSLLGRRAVHQIWENEGKPQANAAKL